MPYKDARQQRENGTPDGAASTGIAMRRIDGRLRRERGQSILELALVVPVLLIVLFAVIDFGFIISDQVILTNAARDGARAGAIAPGSITNATSASKSSAGNLVQCSTPSPDAGIRGSDPEQISVTVTCTYKPITPLGSLVTLIGGTLNTSPILTGKAVMRVEQ